MAKKTSRNSEFETFSKQVAGEEYRRTVEFGYCEKT